MDEALSFGHWLKVRRVALRLTQGMLAEQTGYATATIRKLESDELRPSQQIAERLADVLAIGPNERADFIRWARTEDGAAYRSSFSALPGQPSTEVITSRPSLPASVASPVIPPALPAYLTEQPVPVTRLAPFVGRARELSELEATLTTVIAGKGQILFVIGDAGRGKTTLMQEFARRAQQKDAALLVTGGHCNAHTGMGDPYLPFREVLTTLVSDIEGKWSSGLISTQAARRLWDAIPITIPALVEHAPDLIGPFVPVKTLQSHAALFAPPDTRWVQRLAKITEDDRHPSLEEKRLFAQYTAALKAIAAQRPLLLILEDLHWIDGASSSLLFHLSREIGDSPILILGTYRPDELVGQREERHPLLGITTELKRQHGDIWLDLGNLSAVEGREFVDAYLDTQPNRLGETFRSAFVRHTGGHALFSVELLHEMQARGELHKDAEGYWIEGSAIDWQRLPAKVEAVIEKRIERLEDGLQEMLAIASIEGEAFTAEVVARVQQWHERELVQRLSNELDRQHRLVTAESLNQVGRQRLSRYRFRHYLFQHYLYHRLDVTERAYLHEAVGGALESLYGHQSEQVAVQLAYHYVQAGVTDKAVAYLLQAGELAQRVAANQEAIHHLSQGLALLSTLPDSPQRAQQELALQIPLGLALTAIGGSAAPEVGKTFKRAYELALQIEEAPQLFAALSGLKMYYNAVLQLHTARALAEQMLKLAQNQPDPILRVLAYGAQATLWYMGEFVPAREHFEEAVRLYNPQDHHSYVRLCGEDEGVSCLGQLAMMLWLLGYPEQALQRSRQVLTLAQELAHSGTLAVALIHNAAVHLFRREEQIVKRQADTLIQLATEQELVHWSTEALFLRGRALVMAGEIEGIEQMQRVLNAQVALGEVLHKSYCLAGLAEGYAKAGEIEKGIKLLDEGLAHADKTDNRFWEAEIYRLKGELLLMRDSDTKGAPTTHFAESERCFRQAIEVAQRQQAKSFELRATMSLCKLWQAQGKRAEAHAWLTEIYAWFTEGFDTADLIDAKALLEALS